MGSFSYSFLCFSTIVWYPRAVFSTEKGRGCLDCLDGGMYQAL